MILCFNERGELVKDYAPPSAEVLPEDFIYSPINLLVDKRNWIYIVGEGSAMGIILLDDYGVFHLYQVK